MKIISYAFLIASRARFHFHHFKISAQIIPLPVIIKNTVNEFGYILSNMHGCSSFLTSPDYESKIAKSFQRADDLEVFDPMVSPKTGFILRICNVKKLSCIPY